MCFYFSYILQCTNFKAAIFELILNYQPDEENVLKRWIPYALGRRRSKIIHTKKNFWPKRGSYKKVNEKTSKTMKCYFSPISCFWKIIYNMLLVLSKWVVVFMLNILCNKCINNHSKLKIINVLTVNSEVVSCFFVVT